MATKTEKLSGNNLIIVLLLVTFLVVGLSVLVGKALIGSIVLDTKVVTAKNAADSQLTADLVSAPKLVDAYSALGTQEQVLSDALPTTADFPSLIVTLENMTSTSGVQLKAVAPIASNAAVAPAPTNDGSVAPPTAQPYPFSITFDTTYPNLVKLLGTIETSARPMRVTGMQLNGSGSALSGELDMETFYQDKGQLPFSKETIK